MERRGKVNELLREYLFAISSEAPSTSLVQRGFFLEKGRMKRELTERKLTISKKKTGQERYPSRIVRLR